MTLTVHENLLMGAFNRRDHSAVRAEIDEIYERFPNLAARRDDLAARCCRAASSRCSRSAARCSRRRS